MMQALPNSCITKLQLNDDYNEDAVGDNLSIATLDDYSEPINGDDQSQNNYIQNKEQKSINKNDPISYDVISVSAHFILGKTDHRPKIGVICGTGLGALAEMVSDAVYIPYSSIPNFPISTVEGHVGRLVIGNVGNVIVVLMQGRFHSYEGYPLWQCAMPVRVMKLMGVDKLLVTNAAGAINPSYKVGDFMLLKDHINMPGFSGLNPLKGHNDKRFGPRFFPVTDCYSSRWRSVAFDVASDMGITSEVHQGVYVMLGGPNFETVAEIRLLKLLGVDCVGMSTIPEVLVASHCGMSVLAMSLVTNLTSSDYSGDVVIEHEVVMENAKERVEHEGVMENAKERVEHEGVMENAKEREPILKEFVSKIIKMMGKDIV